MSNEPAENNEPTTPEVPTSGPKRKVLKKRVGYKQRQEELKEEIEHDDFMEAGTTMVDWIIERGNVFGPLAAVLMVVLLAGGLMQSSDQGNREDASAALFKAASDLPESDNPFAQQFTLSSLTSSPEDDAEKNSKIRSAAQALGAVAEEHSGTPQAGIANVKAGHALSRIPDYEAALKHFEAAKDAEGVVGETARSGMAYTLASLSRYDEALSLFDGLVETSEGMMKQQLMVDRAKLYEAKGDSARAQELYVAFEAAFPDSQLLADVRSRITQQ